MTLQGAAEPQIILDPGPADQGVPIASPGLFHRLMRKRATVASLLFLAIVCLAAVLAPWIAPQDPLRQNLSDVLQTPSAAHLLGTDAFGRDVLSRLLIGAQGTLLGVLQAVVVLAVVGVPLGLLAGYFGGWTDRIISRVVELVQAIPFVIILLAVLGVFGRNMTVAMILFGLIASVGLARAVRGSTLAVREELYIASARVSGVPELSILFRHVLPGLRGIIIVQLSLLAAAALLVQTGLSYLGLGATPPNPSWGGMIAEASSATFSDPWLLVPSGGIVALTILAFGLVGDGVRDAAMEGQSRAGGRAWKPARQRGSAPKAIVPGSSPSVDHVLEAVGMSVEFLAGNGAREVVHGFELTVDRGEIVGVVGESGSGKSVTMSGILQLLPANGRVSSGSVVLGGVDMLGASSKQREAVYGRKVGLISQEPMASLDPVFTIGHQLDEIVTRRFQLKRGEARARTIELLSAVRLPNPEQVAGKYPHELSGGMCQRVVIAMALIGDPDLLIADEPTTALDVTVQAEILDLLRRLQRERGMAIILVTHDLGVVADFCSRAVVMRAGEIIERADIDQLFAAPQHPYTRMLLAATPSLVALEGRGGK